MSASADFASPAAPPTESRRSDSAPGARGLRCLLAGGTEGNERLTVLTGLLLIVRLLRASHESDESWSAPDHHGTPLRRRRSAHRVPARSGRAAAVTRQCLGDRLVLAVMLIPDLATWTGAAGRVRLHHHHHFHSLRSCDSRARVPPAPAIPYVSAFHHRDQKKCAHRLGETRKT